MSGGVVKKVHAYHFHRYAVFDLVYFSALVLLAVGLIVLGTPWEAKKPKHVYLYYDTPGTAAP